eukprot:12410785-Alexandrium_andersonii.AAC.1
MLSAPAQATASSSAGGAPAFGHPAAVPGGDAAPGEEAGLGGPGAGERGRLPGRAVRTTG